MKIVVVPVLAAILLCLIAIIQCQEPQTVYRINCGGEAYVDTKMNEWSADAHFNHGIADQHDYTIENTYDQTIFKSERYEPTDEPLQYTLLVKQGSYRVNLYFAEIYSQISGPGQRVFDVLLNGKVVLTDFDQYAQVGGSNKALIRSFVVDMAEDGNLVISFTKKIQNPKINGIEVFPKVTPTPSPPGQQNGEQSDVVIPSTSSPVALSSPRTSTSVGQQQSSEQQQREDSSSATTVASWVQLLTVVLVSVIASASVMKLIL